MPFGRCFGGCDYESVRWLFGVSFGCVVHSDNGCFVNFCLKFGGWPCLSGWPCVVLEVSMCLQLGLVC